MVSVAKLNPSLWHKLYSNDTELEFDQNYSFLLVCYKTAEVIHVCACIDSGRTLLGSFL
jgi:hypothetical protein